MPLRTLPDEKKFGLLAALMTALVLATMVYNLLQEFLVAGAGDYLARRWHYEKAISPKGLTLHEGRFWKEKK